MALQLRIAELEVQLNARRGNEAPHLSAIMAMSIALLTARETSTIMEFATRSAAQLFPGTSSVLAFLADDEDDYLILVAANGQRVEPVRFKRRQGMPGHAYLAPRPMLLMGPELEEMAGELDDEQCEALEALMGSYPPQSALLAPLRTDEQRIGALVISGGSNAHLFLPRDLPFSQALSSLVAVALAEVIERERGAALQHALAATRTLHAEAEARLSTAEAQLLQSAKLAAVGELSASVAHEINNPLYAARNSLYLVDQDLPPDAPLRVFLDIAQSELARIARIVSRMRDFYRPTRDELELVDLNMLIEETLELVQTHLRRGQITIKQELQVDLPKLTAHADQIRQVLLNLMINACDAMAGGGTLRVCTCTADSGDDASNYAQIEIVDTGQGIPEEHLARVFEPFYTTKAHGTGLGLAISAHIVAQHGGQITVASVPQVGTNFTILLPFNPQEQQL